MDILLTALKGVAEETRLRILLLLSHGELTVSELTQILSQSQPRVSRHLRLLVEAGLLSRFREGSWVFYRLVDDEKIRTLLHGIINLIPHEGAERMRDMKRLQDIRQERAAEASAYFAKNAGEWDTIRKLYVGEKRVEEAMLDMVSDRPIQRFLDVGTGTGRILELFSDKIEDGLGIDLNLDMIAVARSNLSKLSKDTCVVRCGDMYDLPVADQSRDLIVFHQVLHFADDPQKAIVEAARVLTAKGAILLVDFAPHTLEHLREDHAHRRLGFSDQEVANWAKQADLKVKKVTDLEGGALKIKIWLIVKN